MTLRERVEDILDDNCIPVELVRVASDAILAAIRTHMTSPEAVERAYAASFICDDADQMKAAILAALGEE